MWIGCACPRNAYLCRRFIKLKNIKYRIVYNQQYSNV